MGVLYEYLKEYRDQNGIRMHMPGHKGYSLCPELASAMPFDITEIVGADSLFEDEGILLLSEQKTAAAFGSRDTLYSVGGSTLCIQTMLGCCCNAGDKVIAGRNAHTAFFNSCVLLDLRPVWVLPEYHPGSNISGEITPEAIEQALTEHPDAVCVYLTTPDYLGCLSDLKEIAAVVHRHGKRLLCDNAHGAYLHFCEKPIHPMDLGADLCCDSAHKTLPALTGAAYLHLAKGCGVTREYAKQVMHLFGSTSPSYLILLSLDLCADYMVGNLRTDVIVMERSVAKLREELSALGGLFEMRRYEPGKLVIDCYKLGYHGEELAALARGFDPPIEPEYVSNGEMVFMFSPMCTDRDYAVVSAWLGSIRPKTPIARERMDLRLPPVRLSMREAHFARKELCKVSQAEGRIAAQNRIVCPPGVPIVAAGEEIDKISVNLLQKTGIFEIFVV